MRLLLFTLLVVGCSCAFHNVKDYGAKGDGKTKDSAAIEKVISAIKKDGGGVIWFPAGRYLTAPFNLTSNIVVVVDPAATILGSTDLVDYPIIPPLPSYCQGREMDGPRYSTLIHADHVDNITITGGGTIDGQGEQWWNLFRNKTLLHTRGGLIEILWANHLIDNPSNSPNTDGIDPDSSTNVKIIGCKISVGDDMIAIKSGMDYCGRQFGKPTANVSISNCVFGSGHGISIGSEMSGGIRNISVTNCVVNGSQNGVRIKTQRGRGGIVEDILFSGITFYGDVGTAILIDMFYSDLPPTNATATPVFRNVHISDFNGNVKVAGRFNCLPEAPCEKFTLDDITLQAKTGFSCSYVNGNFSHVSPQLCFQ